VRCVANDIIRPLGRPRKAHAVGDVDSFGNSGCAGAYGGHTVTREEIVIQRALSHPVLLTFALCTIPLGAAAQAPARETAPAGLVRTSTGLDSALFASYNQCDLDTFASFWASDVEFYHDQTGLMVGVQNLTNAVRENICGKVRRELVPGTLEVYTMRGYGALVTGVHRFADPRRKDSGAVGEAKFMLLWHQRDDGWKITRSISYDHYALTK
jgi:ketosteroid isomerase-like protein